MNIIKKLSFNYKKLNDSFLYYKIDQYIQLKKAYKKKWTRYAWTINGTHINKNIL